MEQKPFWYSKTFWVNFLVIALGVFQIVTQQFPISAEMQVMIVAILNLILRTLTVQPVGFRWKPLA